MSLQLAYFYDLPLPARLAAPIQTLKTAHALAERGVSVTVFCGPIENDDPAAALAVYGLTPHPRLRLRAVYPTKHPRSMLRQALAELDTNAGRRVIMSRGEPGVALYPALRRVMRPDDRFVYEAHRLCFDLAQEQSRGASPLAALGCRYHARRMRRRERRAVENADALVCLTEGVRDALAAHFDTADRPVLILPSGVDDRPTEDRSVLDESGRDIDILYAGKFDARKGVGLLIDALALLPGRKAWLIGGDAAQRREMRARADALGIREDRLHLPGYINPAEIGAYFRRARVGVCPLPAGLSPIAERFTSPMKLLDMMAGGAAVVASDLPSVRAIVGHEEEALLVPPNDAAALAGAVEQLLTDPALATRLRTASREKVRAYTWSRRAQRLYAFLDSLA